MKILMTLIAAVLIGVAGAYFGGCTNSNTSEQATQQDASDVADTVQQDASDVADAVQQDAQTEE